jgi:RNA polymerase sigma factor (sigma-70 family)
MKAQASIGRRSACGMIEKSDSEHDNLGRGSSLSETASELDTWFSREILPLETALMQYLQHNWRNHSDIADLRQEVYVRVLEGASRKLPERPKQFVFAAARNLLIDRVRHAQIVPIEAAVDLEALEIAIDDPGPERGLLAREELQRLQMALDQLPPRCREAFMLGRIEGLNGRQIAQRMGIGVAAVSEHLANAFCALADFLSVEPLRRSK